MTKFDPNKPVQQRNGRRARILISNVKSAAFPIAALIEKECGGEAVVAFKAGGIYALSGAESDGDLVNISPQNEAPSHAA